MGLVVGEPVQSGQLSSVSNLIPLLVFDITALVSKANRMKEKVNSEE